MTGKYRVVLIEDHAVTLGGLQSGLGNEPDIDVVATALDSDEGLELTRSLKPDAVILDLHVPGTLGPRSMIKAFTDLKFCRIIIFSGEDRAVYIRTALEHGVSGYLLKYESSDRVAEAIRAVLTDDDACVLSQQITICKDKITPAEISLLSHLAKGHRYGDIADERKTSPATVRKQCDILLMKLGLTCREELIAWAVRNGYGD